MLSAYNSDMREEVFIDCRNGELYIYIGALDVIIGRKLKRTVSRVELNVLVEHGRIEPMGRL